MLVERRLLPASTNREPCPACKGTGLRKIATALTTCDTCLGTGRAEGGIIIRPPNHPR